MDETEKAVAGSAGAMILIFALHWAVGEWTGWNQSPDAEADLMLSALVTSVVAVSTIFLEQIRREVNDES